MAEPLKKVLVDPSFRRMEEIFHADDLDRLQACCDVIWGQNEPLSESEIQRVKADAFAIVTANWRYGDLSEMPKLKAILEVAGRHPSPPALDTAATTSRQWVKATIGNSHFSIFRTSVFISILP